MAGTFVPQAAVRLPHWHGSGAGWRFRDCAAPVFAALAALAASLLLVPDLQGLFGGLLGVAMIGIAWVDARSFVIPDKLALAALLVGVASAALDPWSPVEALGTASIRGAAAFAAFFLLRRAYARLRGREGLGFGDVKLAGVAGVWLDWVPLAFAIEIAALGTLLMLGLRALRKGRLPRRAPIPFGLFFAPAIWLGWLLQALLGAI